MPYGMYISAEGAFAQSRRLEVLANNLANIDTPGFKRDLALFQARYAEATQRGLDFPGSGTINDLGGGVLVRETTTDFSAGTLKTTGLATDLAIDGDGYFVIGRGDKQLLTKAGNFTFNAANQLVTQDGLPVLSPDNQPVTIDPEAGPWQFTPDGAIVQAGNFQPLALVRPQSVADLSKVGDNLFLPLAPVTPLEDGERHVVPGTIESSDVKPTFEMMELIESSRAFEANMNMIRNQDQMMGTLISRVLKES